MLHEIRYIVRALIRDRPFGVMAVAVVAPGAVLATVLLGFASLARWRPSVPDGARLVYVNQTVDGIALGVSHETVLAIKGLRSTFESVAYKSEDRSHSPDAGSAIWMGEMVSGDYFEVLGLHPVLGRTLLPQDDAPAATRAVVISHRMWRELFQSNKDVLGRALRLGTASTGIRSEEPPIYTIVGVMPESASGISSPFRAIDYWVPVATRALDYACDIDMFSNNWGFTVVGRLSQGITPGSAEAAAASVWRAIVERDFPGRAATRLIRLSSTPSFALPHDRSRIGITRLAMLASGLALAIIVVTMSNISGLLMLRTIRRRQSAVTLAALGAGPWLASRTVLVEAVTIAAVSAIVAPLLLHLTLGLVCASVPLPAATSLPPGFRSDYRWSLLLSGCCLVAGLLAGLLPAYQCRPRATMDGWFGRLAQTPRLGRAHGFVVMPQVALATSVMMLGVTVGVAVLRVEMADPGYSVGELAYARFMVPGPARCKRTLAGLRAAALDHRVTEERMLRDLRQLAGGKGALTSSTPFDPLTSWVVSKDAGEGRPVEVAETAGSRDYLQLIGVTLLKGRFFDGSETTEGIPVAVISAAAARALWKEDPIGKQFGFSHASSTSPPTRWLTVVGVVSDVRMPLSEGDVTPWVYTPLSQRSAARFAVIKSPVINGSVTQNLRDVVEQASDTLRIQDVSSFESLIGSTRYPRRFSAIVLGSCCVLTGWLACVGLYSLMSYATARRVREFAICAALGARRARILWSALRAGVMYAVGGIGAGVLLGTAGLGLTGRVVGEMPALGAGVLSVLSGLLFAVLALASMGPARLTASVDPSRLLRETE